MTLEYRRLTPGCLDETLKIMRRFYTEESLEFREERARGALEELVARPELGGLWLIEVDGVTAGYFVLGVCFSLEFGGRFALLDEFFIEPGLRGVGLGARALERAQEEAARMGVATVRLEVDRDNSRLCAFYARSGFAAHERDLMTKWLRAERASR